MSEKQRDWMSAVEAAYRLGVTRDTMYRLLQDGKIPGMRVGWKWRVSVMALEQMMQEHSGGNGAAVAAADARFKIGDHVEKYTGDYAVFGEVRMVGTTKAGRLRYVIELDTPSGCLMIYNEGQLRLA